MFNVEARQLYGVGAGGGKLKYIRTDMCPNCNSYVLTYYNIDNIIWGGGGGSWDVWGRIRSPPPVDRTPLLEPKRD